MVKFNRLLVLTVYCMIEGFSATELAGRQIALKGVCIVLFVLAEIAELLVVNVTILVLVQMFEYLLEILRRKLNLQLL